jgi:Protein of unknown function (DUF3352)
MVTRGRLLLCAATTAAALAIPACGGDGGGVESDDPASLAPAGAPVYVQATIRPQGRLKADVEALASTVSGFDDPTGRLIELFDEAASGEDLNDPDFNFADDIEPWLGERAGAFVEGFSEDPGAAIVQTTDPDAAAQAVEDGSEADDEQRSYEGIDYFIDEDTATGVVGDFLVLGDEPAFKHVVDVSDGEDSLGGQDEFTDTVDEAPEGSIADVYVGMEAVWEEVRAEDPDSAQGLSASLGDPAGKSALASLVPSADRLELDLITNLEQGFISGDLQELIGQFPASSFAAFGLPDLGQQVDRVLDQLEEQGVGGINRADIDRQLAQGGLNLDELTAALGDLGVFVGGTSERSLQGAGVITTGDSDVVEGLIRQFAALIQLGGGSGLSEAIVGTGFTGRDPEELGPQPLTVTTGNGRIVIGYGDQATRAAFSPRSPTLAEDPTFRQAVGALRGDGVSGYISMPKVFQLADSTGALRDLGYRQARPYLERLSYLILGAGEQGDFTTSKVIVGVKP